MHIDAEPISIGADSVARLLRSIGWVESADLIDSMDAANASQYRECQDWKRRYYALLEQHSPPATREKPFDPQPPPEASD